MITEPEWNIISRKAFPQKSAKAPPFLWTRILALIESEEARRASTWWMQWRWMSRVTATIGLIVAIGVFYLVQYAMTPLDAALEGRSNQEQALQVASLDNPTPADTVGILLGLDS
jgi:anti-sigma-K factor RskA